MRGLLGGSWLAGLDKFAFFRGYRPRCGGLNTFEVRLLTGDLCRVKTHETRHGTTSDCHLPDYFLCKLAFSFRGC